MPERSSHIAELRKFVAPEFVFGIGSRLLAGRYVRNWGAKKVLLVTDQGVHDAGWSPEIAALLEEEGVGVVPFAAVSPNPRDHEVMAGVRLYADAQCDALVAVGGGSVIDAAKGIGIVASNGGHVLDYEGVDRVTVPMPPLICIPTTGGTSADVSQFAIINNTVDQVKIAIISKALVPDVALVDPQTLTTVPTYLGACTGIDALVHAMEAFVSNASSPLTDLHALEAVRLLHGHLASSLRSPQDLEHRSAVMLGSLEAGLAFSNASLGCVHALAHSLGGFLDLPHGECNALLLSKVVEFNFEAAPERYAKLGSVLGCDLVGLSSKEATETLRDYLTVLRRSMGIGGTLRNRGLDPSIIPVLAAKALKDPCNATNPRPPNARDLEVILEESL
jgi:alcohol dehydrogenase